MLEPIKEFYKPTVGLGCGLAFTDLDLSYGIMVVQLWVSGSEPIGT